MRDWINDNWGKIILHSKTSSYVRQVLYEIKLQRMFEDAQDS